MFSKKTPRFSDLWEKRFSLRAVTAVFPVPIPRAQAWPELSHRLRLRLLQRAPEVGDLQHPALRARNSHRGPVRHGHRRSGILEDLFPGDGDAGDAGGFGKCAWNGVGILGVLGYSMILV